MMTFIEDRIAEFYELNFDVEDIRRNVYNLITWKTLNTDEQSELKQNILEELKNGD